MADFRYRHPHNVAGKFYTDLRCLDCVVCREAAPAIFSRDETLNSSYVSRQPTTREEIATCEECLARCPCQAIGDDGDGGDWSVPTEATGKRT